MIRWLLCSTLLLIPVAPAALYGHALVDVQLTATAPAFVAMGETFRVRFDVRNIEYDSAYGVVATITLGGGLRPQSVTAPAGWKCATSGSKVTCSAEEVTPGVASIEVALGAPASTTRLTVSGVLESLGSLDYESKNDRAESTTMIYDRAVCTATAPLVLLPEEQQTATGPQVLLSWSAVPGASSYSVYSSERGEAYARVATTTELETLLTLGAGPARFFVEASFGSCPPLRSQETSFRVEGPARVLRLRRGSGIAGEAGSTDGFVVRYRAPAGLAFGPAGELYVADEGNSTIRRVDANGSSITVGGSAGAAQFADGSVGRFNHPRDVAVTPNDYIFVADAGNHVIRVIYPGSFVATVAGAAQLAGTTDGETGNNRFRAPGALVAAEDGSLFVADTGNHSIRKLTPVPQFIGRFISSTVAGRGGEAGALDGRGAEARFREPAGMAIGPDGAIYIADTGNHTIRRISNGEVQTVAGEAGSEGLIDSIGSAARFRRPGALAFDTRGNLFIADRGNHAIRRLSPDGSVSTVSTAIGEPSGLAFAADGRLYVSDGEAHIILVGTLDFATPRRRPTPP